MRSWTLTLLACLAVIVSAGTPVVAAPYAVTTTGLYAQDRAAVNRYGQVIGVLPASDGQWHAALWTPTSPHGLIGGLTDLHPGEGGSSFALEINSHGQVVIGQRNGRGWGLWSPTAANGVTRREYLNLDTGWWLNTYGLNDRGSLFVEYQDGWWYDPYDLDVWIPATPNGTDFQSQRLGYTAQGSLNNRGVASNGDRSFFPEGPEHWPLTHVPGVPRIRNDYGQGLRTVTPVRVPQVEVWQPDSADGRSGAWHLIRVGARADKIGEGGHILGVEPVTGAQYLWLPDAANGLTGADLFLGLAGGRQVRLSNVNASGVAVGYGEMVALGERRAAVFRDGAMRDLNRLVPVGTPLLVAAHSVNDFGQIVCSDADARVYLLTPTTPRLPLGLTVGEPWTGVGLKALGRIAGVAGGGRGVREVSARLRRAEDRSAISGRYWSPGTGWVEAPTALDVAGRERWAVTSTLPAGSDLPDGWYVVEGDAADTMGATASTRTSFIVDRVKPTGRFTNPVNGGVYYNSLGAITGTAADVNGGSGIQTVSVKIRRINDPTTPADDRWWHPRERWTTTETLLPTNNSGEWSVLPYTAPSGGEYLPDGLYRLYLVVRDRAENSQTAHTILVLVDRAAPTGQFTFPTAGTCLAQFARVTGTATDGMGSGVGIVKVRLRRVNDPTDPADDQWWWPGEGWLAGQSSLNTTNQTTWRVTDPLPTLAETPEGRYLVYLDLWDHRGNRRLAADAIAVTVDRTAPTGRITTPADGEEIAGLPEVAGIAADAPENGSLGVFVRLRQLNDPASTADDRWWTPGTGWGTTQTLLKTDNLPNWTVTDALPDGATLSPGTYKLYLLARDRAGNSAVAHTITVTVR